MADIVKDGTDQMIVCPIVDSSWNPVTSAISGLVINFILNNGSDVTLSTTLTYSASAGGHKLIVPNGNITACGRYTCKISGIGIRDYILDGLVIPDPNILRKIGIVLFGSVSGLTAGSGTPVQFSTTDGSYIIFTVNADGNRTLSSTHLV